MVSCVAVTRNGWGDVWGFPNPNAAHLHPLIQGGDTIMTSVDDVVRYWNWLHIGRLFGEVLGDSDQATDVTREMQIEPMREQRHRSVCERAWLRLQRAASPPPSDPVAILTKITSDRQMHDAWCDREATRRTNTMNTTETNTTTAPKEKAAPAVKTTAGKHGLTSKISFGADKEGKKYGKDNNPKRAASASFAKFELYKDGMTVQAALDAGLTVADLNWDSEKNFIKIS